MVQIDMDMPKSCADCPCVEVQDGWCFVHNEALERMGNGYPNIYSRPKWCPIHEPKKGKWIKADSQQYFRKHYPCFTCSECGYRKDSQKKWNYCPNCGAEMREES